MYLIDDRMYKDNILNRQNNLMTLNNTITQNQFTDRKYSGIDSNPEYFMEDVPNGQIPSQHSKQDHENDKKPEEKQVAMDGILRGKPPLSSGLSSSTSENVLKETQSTVDSNKNTRSADEANMSIDSSPPNVECDCSGTTSLPSKQMQLPKKTKVKPRRKKTLSAATKSSKKSSQLKENDDSSDDELRKRLHKLRHDYDNSQNQGDEFGSSPQINASQPIPQLETSPPDDKKTTRGKKAGPDRALENHTPKTPQKKNPVRITKTIPSLEGDDDKISFICTICNSRFKRFHSLSRHMNNLHPDYFGNWSKKNKRANEEPEAPNNKKAKWDGRMKRRLQTIDENGDKKIRREFKCFFCSQHFRTESSLERHKRAIHTPPIRTEKRKGMELDPTTDTYVKRQKGDPKKAIQYSNLK